MANLPPDQRVKFQANAGTNVLSGSGAAPIVPQQNTQQGITTATNNQGANQAPTQSGQKSSGMFTNIKSYIQKNQPQAQAMAGAAVQDFNKQAGNIAQQAQEREAQFKNQISTQNQNLAAQKTAGQNIINQASNFNIAEGQKANAENIQNAYANAPVVAQQDINTPTAPVAPTFDAAADSSKNFNNFQDLIQGKKEDEMAYVRDLDLSKQQYRVEALKNLATGAKTDQGRANVLSETFGKRRAYTGGQTGLDNAILGGDSQAQKSLITGTQAATTGIDTNLKGKYEASLADKSKLRTDVEGLKGELGKSLDTSMGNVVADAEKTAQERRDASTAEQENVRKMFQTGEGLTDENINKYMDMGAMDNQRLEAIKNASSALTGSFKGRANNFESAFGEDYGKTYAGLQSTVKNGLENPKNKDPDAIAYNKARRDGDENKMSVILKNRTENRYKMYVEDKVSKLQNTSANDYLRAKIGAGQDVASNLNFASVDDLNAQNSATESQLARYEALKRLKGDSSIGSLDMNKERYVRGREASGNSGNINSSASSYGKYALKK